MTKAWFMGLVTLGFVTETVWAGGVTVPEIDGGSAMLAVGLTAGLVALIRERARKK